MSRNKLQLHYNRFTIIGLIYGVRAGAPSPARVLSTCGCQTASVSFYRFDRPVSSYPCKYARPTCFGIAPFCRQWLSSSGHAQCCAATAQKWKARITMNITAKKSNTSARFWGRKLNSIISLCPKKTYKTIHKSHNLRLIKYQ